MKGVMYTSTYVLGVVCGLVLYAVVDGPPAREHPSALTKKDKSDLGKLVRSIEYQHHLKEQIKRNLRANGPQR